MAYRVPLGEEGAIAPQFSPEAVLDAEGRLFCVPEQVLGVPADGDGPEFDHAVRGPRVVFISANIPTDPTSYPGS